MTPDFEKQMKTRLDDANPQDLLGGFDAGSSWQGIRERMEPVSKKQNRTWLSHAAAVAAGILITCAFWATRQHDVSPAYTVIRDTIYHTRAAVAVTPVTTPMETLGQQPARRRPVTVPPRRPQPVKQAPALVQGPVDKIILPGDTLPAGTQTQVAVTVPAKTGVVHMLDMNNEDRDIAQNATPVALGNRPIRLSKPGTTCSNTPYAVQAVIQSFTSNR